MLGRSTSSWLLEGLRGVEVHVRVVHRVVFGRIGHALRVAAEELVHEGVQQRSQLARGADHLAFALLEDLPQPLLWPFRVQGDVGGPGAQDRKDPEDRLDPVDLGESI